MKEPVARSDLRLALGGAYYGTLRKLLWIKERSSFTRERCEAILPYSAASHKTPLMRRLRDVDMWMQENKVTNLRLASARVNGIVLHPGQTFSYWYLIGRPTARKGYLPGMLLRNGRAVAGVGGGLCQLSNLIFWMTLHTPLTVTERHRHGYDVFPDSDRTQPFGSGATCFYPYGDLMIRNDTQEIIYQSKAIPIGSKIERAKLDVELPAGTYECTAMFHNLDPETGNVIGTAGAIITITIKN